MKEKEKQKILKSGDVYHKMIEEVQDYAILLIDRQGIIQNWNKGAEKIKGYSESEILGQNFNVFYLPEDRKKQLPQQLIAQAAETGRAHHEGWRVRKDGSTFWGYIVITALHDQQGNVIGFTKVTRDLTEKKRAEDQREKDDKRIALQHQHLQEFAHITSHDLQEPIRKIQTFAGLARKNADNRESLYTYLGKIDSAAQRMVNLIKDVLDFSRLSQSREQFSIVDLNSIILEVLDDFELSITEKKAKLTIAELPSLYGVPIQLKQLFSNLIGNALKFSPEAPEITVSYHKTQNPPTAQIHHVINVEDKGIGFDMQYAEQAFEPFKRLTSQFAGSGIGLALCKKIIENHNGTIQVLSEPGKGTVFTITLPQHL